MSEKGKSVPGWQGEGSLALIDQRMIMAQCNSLSSVYAVRHWCCLAAFCKHSAQTAENKKAALCRQRAAFDRRGGVAATAGCQA
ncbi:MAG: hypothetical protein CMI13_12760 [Oleibacter sp.]|nr:hypothetical protein [Thalassolituus sp.]